MYCSVTESYRESYRDLSWVILKFLTRNKINENFMTSQMMKHCVEDGGRIK